MGMKVVREEGLTLFESKQPKGGVSYKLFSCTIMVGIVLTWIYRIAYFPRAEQHGRWAWFGMFMSELFFSFYWLCTQSVRWNVNHRYPFKDRLSQRYEEARLPGVDIFVCTADPTMEPPVLVMNTILSALSYNYPTEKLSVYLSDDGGSELTFYALLEASHFSKHWIPFCKRHNVEPRSPENYFAQMIFNVDMQENSRFAQELLHIKKLYEEIKNRIESTAARGNISKELKSQHKGFSEWGTQVTKSDHHSIVQIIIDGRDKRAVDIDGYRLPTLVYMAREKKPFSPHNFKAGAMNALIRVSSEISNGPIILNLDCDMSVNDPDAIRDALCFFMDEENGHDIAYVQYPQTFLNVTKNDLYANACPVVNKVELAGLGAYNAALYCGTCCFHRRQSLCGMKYSKDSNIKKKGVAEEENLKISQKTVIELEEAAKAVSSCKYEEGTQWGKQMGLVYGCPVEDIVTGLTIQCRGWKSICYCPKREAFQGVAPTTLDTALIQFKRWSEGMFQIFISKYCPFTYGHGKIKLGAQMGYSIYLLWAPISLPTLYYVIVPPLCLLRGIPLFPQISSLWFIPFGYVFITKNVYSMVEALRCGYTFKAWWNLQRMWLIRRTTAYLFAFIDVAAKTIGFQSGTAFTITDKVVTDEVQKRYEQEVMEFGSSTIMFTIVATLAMLNLFALIGYSIILAVLKIRDALSDHMLIPQIILCGLLVMVNWPVYEALFVRNDKGRMPTSIMYKSIIVASLACLIITI